MATTVPQAPLGAPIMSVPSPIPNPFEATPRASPVNEIVIEGLNHPTLFLPLPTTDPLNALLSKHIPAEARPHRDLVGRYEEQTLETLVDTQMSNSWRALARMAKDRIVATPSADTTLVLDLWSLRLTSLARMRLFNQATAECSNLYSVLNTISPPSVRRQIVPYELDVFYARTIYWSGDLKGYLDELTRLIRLCKSMARRDEKPGSWGIWTERGMRTGMMVVTQLIEMQDYPGALSILRPLAIAPKAPSEIRFALARIMMEAGIPNPSGSRDAGKWEEAEEMLRKAHEDEKENGAIALLESMLKVSPASFVAVEPFLYNLATLYELRSNAAADRKRNMLREVAQWGGDGIKTSALKLPS
ncbi:kinetochore assembly [Rhizoctonia solani]|uniref:Kinetochore assembly n=1 Tax=Rhizoctonia solani TaxID=456999 RepID=A0A8H7IJ94_9AGAM|nr:kinetochore assembly [Rhizoctonia solani]